ncbi:MAG: NADPH:quinone reductase-like Zn-dependent oxidoreductase [Polaribacter sp.]
MFGFTDTRLESQAEYIILTPIENLFTIPENIDYKQAIASLEEAHYTYTFIHKVNIQSGQRILVNAATEGIDPPLLKFVKQCNVKITATCNTKNLELIKSLGADKVYDFKKIVSK